MKPTILIVDDEAGVRSALERRAARRGLRRRGGRQRRGVPRARRRAAPYDVIVLDIWLPGHGRPGDAGAAARAAGRRAGGDDLRPRQHRVGGARDQDGRVRLRREAAVAREDGAGRRATRCASGGSRPRTARCAPASIAQQTMVGESYAMRAAARAGRDGGADQRPRADLRRERHRQGAGRAHHPRAEPPARRRRSSR